MGGDGMRHDACQSTESGSSPQKSTGVAVMRCTSGEISSPVGKSWRACTVSEEPSIDRRMSAVTGKGPSALSLGSVHEKLHEEPARGTEPSHDELATGAVVR